MSPEVSTEVSAGANRYTLTATLPQTYTAAVAAVRDALGEQGFGVLTEIDIAATMKAKLDVDLPPQIILGACRPPLAYAALQADPSIAAMLPCNVVVRSLGDNETVVEVFDPAAMTQMSNGGEALASVAADARARLTAMLETIKGAAR